ncbi:phospholipase A1-like [Coccinella septempunctata]|uniref:phospholipase A1-like n=1 Tax=Coccinella septempunctata TaxID=41139 RepID=UPI001D06B715|nr:phospholipase A1-like [Coccinella septempunctata]
MSINEFFFCVFVCVVITDRSHAGSWGLPDPLAAAGSVVKVIDDGAKTVASGAVDGAKATAEVAYAADRQVVKGSKTVLGKVNSGVFDVEKGFVNGLDEVVGTPVDLKELTFHLVTSKNVGNPTKIDFYKPDDVANTTGKIFFIIHGWQSSSNASWVQDLAGILVRKHPDAHVVQVNWDGPASDNYAFAAFDTESVGNFVGILVNRLVSEYKVPRENIVLIGHSLGGQICGWAGKKFGEITGTKLPRIIALDPAGPLFILRPDTRRLNKHDAEVVMVIHTDGDKLGFPFNCGTIDFYPNGGDNQPGCWEVDLGRVATYVEPVTCDHSRAWDFYVEALNTTGSFPSRKCKSFSDFANNICESIEAAMGDLELKLQGTFYLETNPNKSYSKLLPKIVDKIKEGIETIKDEIKEIKDNSTKSVVN